MVRLRFVEATASRIPDLPFVVGQVIELGGWTPEARGWVRDGRAVLLHQTAEETATLGDPTEVAMAGSPKKRGHR